MNSVKDLIPAGAPGSGANDFVPSARDVSGLGLFWVDKTTDKVVLDANAQVIFGYDVGHYPYETFTEHLNIHSPISGTNKHNEALESYEATLDRQGHDQIDRVRSIANAKGDALWLRLIERDLFADDGRPYMLGIVMDVTADVAAYIELWNAKSAIAESERLIDVATQASDVGLWRVDLKNASLWFSDSWFTVLGYAPTDMDHTLEAFNDLIHPDDIASVEETLQSALANPAGTYADDFRLRRKDGGYSWIGSAGKVIRDDDGQPSQLVGAQLDISDRIADQQRIQDAADAAEKTLSRLTKLAENVPGGMYELIITPDGEMSIPYLSEGFASLVGQSVAAIQSDAKIPFEHVVPEDAERLFVAIEESLANLTEFKETYRLVHPQRGLQYLRGNSTPVREADGSTRWYGCLMDVTEEFLREKALEDEKARTEEKALHDPLTNLPNRRAFDNEMTKAPDGDDAVSTLRTLVRIDLDRFKLVNDRMGHAAGDAVLCKMADILIRTKGPDDLAARIGGDEFVIVLGYGKGVLDAEVIIASIKEAIKQPFFFERRRCNFGASFGIASTEAFDQHCGTLLSDADAALYEAKAAGRGRTEIFTPALQAKVSQIRERLSHIQEGIDRQEFFPYFQPQIDAQTGELAGCEALARWVRPSEGLIPPDRFLPAAQMMNAVQDIDRLVFEKSLGTIDRIRQAGLVLPKMSFNVSIGRILDPIIVESVKNRTTSQTQLAFELLESILIEEEGAIFASHVEKLKDLGISMEVDDFGSGHASIIGVMRVSPTCLKIDQRLILPLVKDEAMRVLVGAIIDMAHALGIDVTAEGVETYQHAQLLKDMGCNTLQGYAFARPMPEDDLIDFIANFEPQEWQSIAASIGKTSAA